MTETTTVPRIDKIDISKLLLDTQNPRLPDVQSSQRETIQTMAMAQGEKIIGLAKHIRDNGTNPASLLIVMPSESDDGKFVVLDGNRRLTAIKVLENPSLVEAMLTGNAFKTLKQISTAYAKKPIDEMHCAVVNDRDEADTWIELIHRGEQSGAGLVEWDGQVAARYDARKGKKSAALQVLDFAKENAKLSDETQRKIVAGRFPITNLSRLLGTPYVRNKLGIDIQNDKVVTPFPSEEVIKGLTRVVEEIGSGQITVSDIKKQAQRIDYINSLDQAELPQQEKKLLAVRPLGEPQSEEALEPKSTFARKAAIKTPSTKRSTLIPGDCRLTVTHSRIKQVYFELKRLNLNEFPNAGAVMFRVFIELSLDYFIENSLHWSPQKIDNTALAQKLNAVANHFEKSNVMTAQQLSPIRKAVGGQTLLAASVKTFHSYVHSRYFSPVASELRTAWDDLQPFMENIWPKS